jgi:toxin-antitoxin system PIN domain toxin
VTALLDANVLVAVCTADHVHHDAAATWLADTAEGYATTPITQGAVVRFLMREGVGATDALAVLESVTAQARHEFWPDDLPFESSTLKGVIGHRQVTDAYLASLARRRHGKIATLARGLAALHADVAELIET